MRKGRAVLLPSWRLRLSFVKGLGIDEARPRDRDREPRIEAVRYGSGVRRIASAQSGLCTDRIAAGFRVGFADMLYQFIAATR